MSEENACYDNIICCPPNSWPAGNSGTKSLDGVTGELLTIGDDDLEIYITSSPSYSDPQHQPKRAIMVFTDVYGLQNRLFAICDKLSREINVPVVALDTFRGETKDDHLDDFIAWTSRHPYEEVTSSTSDETTTDGENKTSIYPVSKDIDTALDFLVEKYNVDPSCLSAIGFCWGVWAVTKACAMGKFKCGVGFHPTLKFEDIHGGDQITMTKTAAEKSPLFFCVAGNDMDNLKPPNGEVYQIISSSKHETTRNNDDKPRCVEFPDMVHGWVSRGDTSIDKVKEDAEAALNMACVFLYNWM